MLLLTKNWERWEEKYTENESYIPLSKISARLDLDGKVHSQELLESFFSEIGKHDTQHTRTQNFELETRQTT